jgi:hypothetical protein
MILINSKNYETGIIKNFESFDFSPFPKLRDSG